MKLVSKEPCEFRIQRTYESKSGKTSFIYTFENDDLGSFELFSSNNLGLTKGSLYTLVFNMGQYNGDIFYRLDSVEKYAK